ncbi:Sugar diacid regulator [Bhargavaea cecembensis DSE10]|uniref:Sugar diacid regulator n=1 Tax=Bhargavaea cecembensis DSE10 TaxID=1235279 RepID=M7P7V4_9BACL|nr:PucR family transcriptional regulator [Bhargavaea cecembensis]EMR06599.1 Sugar diacid regulator [Bhargavaea cecembensis DSE10]
MELTMRDLLKLGGFTECQLVAGERGLKRQVNSITVLEVPEVAKWAKGGEFMLTSLYAVKDDLTAQLRLLERLNASGASGIGIKPAHFIGEIPKVLLARGNELEFPIIEIPEHLPYLDLMSPAMHALFNKKVVLQEDLDRATRLLEELSLTDQGIGQYVKTISFILKTDVSIESELPTIDSSNIPEGLEDLSDHQKKELTIVKRPLKLERRINEKLVSCAVAPIIVEGEYFGNITSWNHYIEYLANDVAILERAASKLSFEFLKQKVHLDIEQRYESDFMRELLFSETIREKQVVEWGGKYRIGHHQRYTCLLFSVLDSETGEKQYHVLKNYRLTNYLKQLNPQALVGAIRNGICIILPNTSDQQLRHMANQYYNGISGQISQNFRLALGTGKSEIGVAGIQDSFLQAEKALYFAETEERQKRIIYYDNLGIYRLIYSVRNEEELRSFYFETFQGLLQEAKRDEFFETLRTYFLHDESLKETANALFIHVNTLKYRLRKIEELSGYSLRKTEGKMNLFIGLKIAELIKV